MDRRQFLQSGGLFTISAAGVAPRRSRKKMNDVIILAGQSNMSSGNKYQPPVAPATVPTVLWPSYYQPVYANAARIYVKPQPWNSGGYPQQPISITNPGGDAFAVRSDPIHSTPYSGVGPGMAMADRYLALKNDEALNVGLVPCGWSGSSMYSEWIRFRGFNTAYGMMVARAIAAKSWGTLRCLVWYQGENDASGPTYPYPAWIAGLDDLISKFRQAVQVPDLPVIVTKLGTKPNSNFVNWDVLNGQIDCMVGVDPKIAVVDATDKSTTDSLHKTVAAQVTLGHQYADALVAMQ